MASLSRLKYLINPKIKEIVFKTSEENLLVGLDTIKESIQKANDSIREISNFPIDIFSLLGMRNLSAFLGEVFVTSFVKSSNGMFVKNPHQDGYPDLLAMTPQGIKEWKRLINNLQDKRPFSPFVPGGIEVKATCGSLPTPAIFSKWNLKKPTIGDNRIKFVTGYDWKSHHRETNNLMGIFWDFIKGVPMIVALFYCTELAQEDWGAIIQPRVNGGRTTSVSIMTRTGVSKMYNGWIAVLNDEDYINFFNKYNHLAEIPLDGAVPV